MNVLNKLKKFADKEYRDGYLRTQVGAGIAYQVQALRNKLGLTQKEFAERTGKKQTVISRLENSMSGSVTVRTLLDVASGADVALLVQFVSYPEFLARTANMSEAALQPETIDESIASLVVEPARASRAAAFYQKVYDQWSGQRESAPTGSILLTLTGSSAGQPPSERSSLPSIH